MKNAVTCPPVLTNALVDDSFGFYETVARGTVDYFTSALVRQATPLELGLDALNWWGHVTRRDKPQWSTPHRITSEWPIARLRDFSPAGTTAFNATLFLPPQAGHDSCIVDYDPQQSQVKTALEAGLESVFSLDWVGATNATKTASIEDYVAVIAQAIQIIDAGPVNLVGDCQGGWLAVIYTALYPETVSTLTIAGAPVDFHAGDAQIHDWMGVLGPERDLTFYRSMVDLNGGNLPGDFLLGGFIALQPANELDKHLQLLAHIDEPAHVARYRTFERWFQHTQPIPGAFYLWIIEHLFQNNELVQGMLRVGDRTVDLKQITCPLNLLAGASDHITPPPQVYALAEYSGTPRNSIKTREANGGHLGLFMGKEALVNEWAPLFEALAARHPRN